MRSDVVLLERILLNLVSNAVRYTTRGGVVVGCRRRGEQLRIEVWDSGPGIPEDQRKNIFGEFYQLAGPERERHAGLGLGLSIVDRLCRILDHRLELTSTVGKGSRFAVMVPMVAAPARSADAPSAPPAAIDAATGQLVVIIEDDPLGAGGHGRAAARAGASASWPLVTRRGLGWRRQARPDVPTSIISDYQLSDGRHGNRGDRALRRDVPRGRSRRSSSAATPRPKNCALRARAVSNCCTSRCRR